MNLPDPHCLSRTLLLSLTVCCLAADGGRLAAQEHSMQVHFDQVQRLLTESDSFAAIQYIQQQGEPSEVVELYLQTALWLYNHPKNVAGMVAISRAGIQYGLTVAERLAEDDPEAATTLHGQAKAIAYNLGANMWPGWQDEGIDLTARDRQAGADAARVNLRLAVELERDDLPMCNAHWLVGAHDLAGGDYAGAIESFNTALEHARAANNPEFEWMCQGYRWMAARLAEADSEPAQTEFDRAVSELRQLDTEDATFFADQLESVFAFFSDSGRPK
jgi:hypothetical protein